MRRRQRACRGCGGESWKTLRLVWTGRLSYVRMVMLVVVVVACG
jgi:hypothetical protein